MNNIFDIMNKDELLFELHSALRKIADYEKIFSGNLPLNNCKKIIGQYKNFDKLIYSVSSRIISSPVCQMEKGIVSALEQVANYTETTRCTVYLFSDDFKKIYNAYEWTAIDSENMQDKIPELDISEFKNFTDHIRKKEIIILGNPEQIPVEAIAEKKWYSQIGFRPTIMVPLIYDGALSGILGVFGRKNERKNWSQQLGKQLHLVAEIIMSGVNIKKNDENLKIAEKNFCEFFRRANAGNVILNRSGKIVDVNPAFAKITGYKEEELKKLDKKDLVFSDDWRSTSQLLEKVFTGEINEYVKKTRLIRNDGSVIWTNFSVAAIKNSKNEIINLICVVTDITTEIKNKQAIEGIIKSSSAKTGKKFFESMVKELAYVLNASYAFVGEIKFYDEKFVSTLAICNKRKIIENIEFRVNTSPVKMVFEQGFCSIHCDVNKKFPKDIFVKESKVESYIAIPLFDMREEIIGVMGVLFENDCNSTNLAESILYLFATRTANELERMYNEKAMAKLNQQLNEKNEELAQIIFVTSHDLRSPLVNVKGFSTELTNSIDNIKKIIESEPLSDNCKEELGVIYNEEIKESVGFINSSVDKMDSLLSGLLRLSRLGRAAVMFDEHNANNIFEEVLRTFEFQIKEKNIKIILNDLPQIYGDKIQLNQVFSNIIDNAIKYSDPGKKLVIEISGKKINEEVEIEIKDSGIGIEEKYLPKVFEIFHRIEPKDDNGLGLGMALAKKIMERHSGSIKLVSEIKKGTSFFVKLPCKRLVL